MLELNDYACLVVEADAHAVLEIGSRNCHGILLYSDDAQQRPQ